MKQYSLCIVSTNKGKVREAQHILGFPLEQIDLELDEIQSLDIEEIARKKAEEAFRIIKKPLIVDDVGLYLNVWKGFPGPLTKFLEKSSGYLHMLRNEANRRAVVKAVIGYHDGKKVHTFLGEVEGEIVKSPRGNGWGFDPIFMPIGKSKTFAEMTIEEKSKISHRKKALKKL